MNELQEFENEAQKKGGESVSFINDKAELGFISRTSLKISWPPQGSTSHPTGHVGI
jgi:hypothetical protein